MNKLYPLYEVGPKYKSSTEWCSICWLIYGSYPPFTADIRVGKCRDKAQLPFGLLWPL